MSSVLPQCEKSIFSPLKELVAYEYLRAKRGASLKKIAAALAPKNTRPSDLVEEELGFVESPVFQEIQEYILAQARADKFSIMWKNDIHYPRGLQEVRDPVDLFYYQGDAGLLERPAVSIVGTRTVSADGRKRTEKLARLLCEHGYIIVSGLAKGVDTVALSTAMELNKKVIAVIGTPINEFYPKENTDLQRAIAQHHLLISQVPFFKYQKQSFRSKRSYFPERNSTMSAISQATIIVEASNTSGTLTQARACIRQGRKLFILNSCFEDPTLTWPALYEEQGAIRVRNIEDIITSLQLPG